MEYTAGNTTSSTLTTKIERNIKILFNTFTNDDHHINIAENFPTVTQVTTIDILNCIWLNELLHKNMGSPNKNLTVINFYIPPTNHVGHPEYSSMSKSLATAHREHDIFQDVNHSKPKM